MFMPPVTNPNQQRTLAPLYATTQATPYAGFLDPEFLKNPTVDILPGTVMYRKKGEVFAPLTSAVKGTAKAFGLSALFVAPKMRIDEVSGTGSNMFSVWVGGNDSLFEILAPAFDTTASYALKEDGSKQYLTANDEGRLTTTGATKENAVAELIDVISTNRIVVRLGVS